MRRSLAVSLLLLLSVVALAPAASAIPLVDPCDVSETMDQAIHLASIDEIEAAVKDLPNDVLTLVRETAEDPPEPPGPTSPQRSCLDGNPIDEEACAHLIESTKEETLERLGDPEIGVDDIPTPNPLD